MEKSDITYQDIFKREYKPEIPEYEILQANDKIPEEDILRHKRMNEILEQRQLKHAALEPWDD